MKNNITELVFILDKSGSMSGLEKDTIGGFNAMIEKQKQQDGRVYVSTLLFSNGSQLIHDRVNINRIEPMTEKEYFVGGGTALMDAIGSMIHRVGMIHHYARPEDVPEHTIFVITTDGMENASRQYSAEKVREMIRKEQDKYGWEFLFLAANIDAAETASGFGIRRENAVNYCPTSAGTEAMYKCASRAVSALRCSEVLDRSWGDELMREE